MQGILTAFRSPLMAASVVVPQQGSAGHPRRSVSHAQRLTLSTVAVPSAVVLWLLFARPM